MTKQEELDHINSLLQLHLGGENCINEKRQKEDNAFAFSGNGCFDGYKPDLASEYYSLSQCTQPSLVLVGGDFFSFCEKMKSSSPVSTYAPPENPVPHVCHCNCGNNCCTCNAPVVKPKTYHCTVAGCNYSTIRKSDMRIHIRTHTGEKPFKCTVEGCGYASITSSDLKKHMKVHSNNKVYKCPNKGCGFVCTSRAALKKHKEMHSSPKVKCPIHHDILTGDISTAGA